MTYERRVERSRERASPAHALVVFRIFAWPPRDPRRDHSGISRAAASRRYSHMVHARSPPHSPACSRPRWGRTLRPPSAWSRHARTTCVQRCGRTRRRIRVREAMTLDPGGAARTRQLRRHSHPEARLRPVMDCPREAAGMPKRWPARELPKRREHVFVHAAIRRDRVPARGRRAADEVREPPPGLLDEHLHRP